MKISCTSNEIIIIEFTRDELESCHLTYEKLDSNELKSKTAICRIISETQKLSGESIRISEKTRVDILPDGEGGCLIVLNSKDEEKPFEKLKIYQSDSIDPIIDFAKTVVGNESAKSSLYKKGNIFRLVLEGEKALHLRCSEFLSLFSECESEIHRTKENFDCVISSDALKVLGGLAF